MKHTLINGETLEIYPLDILTDADDLGQRWLRYGVILRDLNGSVIFQTQMRWRETDQMLRRHVWLKPTIPERAIANLRTRSEIYFENGRHGRPAYARIEALQDLFGHLRRRRLHHD